MSRPFPYRLRAERKRSGFAQHEVAYLLGFDAASVISRLERGERQADLRTALACQLLFERHAHELFPAAYDQARALLAERAVSLAERLRQGEPTAGTLHRLKRLEAVLAVCEDGS